MVRPSGDQTGCSYIHDNKVGLILPDHGKRFTGVVRARYDLDIKLIFEYGTHAITYDLVIVYM